MSHDSNSSNVTPSQLSDSELIDYILNRFHRPHREDLENLIKDAKTVEQVHRHHQKCPHGLANRLFSLKCELEQHMFKEENILFPMIKSGQGAFAVGPITVMKHEHDLHNKAIEELETQANIDSLPEDACATWTRLSQGVSTLVSELREHIELENGVLFARQVAD